MFDEVLWLSMNSEGGVSYTESYNMPIAYRTMNILKISEINKKKNEEMQKSQGRETSLSMTDLSKRKEDLPDFVSQRAAKK
jgi:hypothetical protein